MRHIIVFFVAVAGLLALVIGRAILGFILAMVCVIILSINRGD